MPRQLLVPAVEVAIMVAVVESAGLVTVAKTGQGVLPIFPVMLVSIPSIKMGLTHILRVIIVANILLME